MILVWVVLGCLAGGVLSLAAAGVLTLGLPPRWLPRMIGFSAGVLLASALLDLLPEAFNTGAASGITPESLFATLLVCIIALFFLQRVALWRHGHEVPDSAISRSSVPVILLGDSVHNGVDGVLIAAAFLTDPALGISTTLAIIAHEIPQEAGDFVLLRAAGLSVTRALWLNGLSSLASVLGGVAGYLLLDRAHSSLPYVVTAAAASFLYVAIADLLPLLARGQDLLAALWQGGFLAGGVAVIAVSLNILH